jgi:hypothetical protein
MKAQRKSRQRNPKVNSPDVQCPLASGPRPTGTAARSRRTTGTGATPIQVSRQGGAPLPSLARTGLEATRRRIDARTLATDPARTFSVVCQ